MTTDDEQKRKEEDAAWEQRERERASDPIPAYIWNRLATYKKKLSLTAATLERVLEAGDEAAIQFIKGAFGTEQQAFLKKLRCQLPTAQIAITNNRLEIWWVGASTPLLKTSSDPGEKQNCLLVCYLFAAPNKHGLDIFSQWGLEIPAHCSGRYLMRLDTHGKELQSALIDACKFFLHSHCDVVLQHMNKGSTVGIPVPGGSLVGEIIGSYEKDNGRCHIYFRARTFKLPWMLRADEIALPTARPIDTTMREYLWEKRDEMNSYLKRKTFPAELLASVLPTNAFGLTVPINRKKSALKI